MRQKASAVANPKAAVPVLLFTFVFCLIIDNGFKTMTGPMAEGLGIDPQVASLQASLAGVIIGVGAVVYAALADAFPIRRLMLIGVVLIVIGSLMGFLSSTWPIVLAGRIIQTCGLAAAETLYVIYVTKQLPAAEQKKYLGFSTASFQAGLLIGALTSGFISTYVSWKAMFLVPLILLLAIPGILRTIPEDESTHTHLDIWGLLFIAIFAASLTMYMQQFDLPWLGGALIGLILFVIHVIKGRAPLVTPEFFTHGRYVWAIIMVFIVYSTQMGYIYLLPFAVAHHHGLSQSQASTLMIPGYICAILVGIFSGNIGKHLSSRVTIYTALSMIVGALVLAALTVTFSVVLVTLSLVAFASGFALLYAPLVNTALSPISADKSGVAIGFYNLIINTGIPLGIAYTAKMLDLKIGYNTTLIVLGAIALAGALIYVISDRVMFAHERAAGIAADVAANR